MKKILKGIGLALLFISMAYASNWDLPKETRADFTAEHQEEIRQYYEIVNHETHTEELEAWGGSLPEEVMKND